MAQEPASIRYKNPGAMWGSALAVKWGASPHAITLNDGKGQGNNIAVFPTYVQGICAQLDLWRTAKYYKNKKFSIAINSWSGGNSVEQYIAFVLKRVPGMTRNTVMDDEFWNGPMAIPFLKAQAWHEAGKKYPAPDEDWIEAQQRVLGTADNGGEDAPEAMPAPVSEPPSWTDKIVPIGRSVAGTAFGTAAAGQVAATVTDSPSIVADKVTSVVTKTGEVVSATTQTTSVAKPGLWNGVLSFVSSPGFLVSMIVLMGAMWFLVWFVQKQRSSQP